jgi:hypothetical protein
LILGTNFNNKETFNIEETGKETLEKCIINNNDCTIGRSAAG